MRLDGRLEPVFAVNGCDWDTEHDGMCPVDPCQCRADVPDLMGELLRSLQSAEARRRDTNKRGPA